MIRGSPSTSFPYPPERNLLATKVTRDSWIGSLHDFGLANPN